MSKEFAEWFHQWLNDNYEQVKPKDVAAYIGVRPAVISQWRHGVNNPQRKHIAKLAELTGESPHFIAKLAFGWEMDAPTDPLLQDEMVRRFAQLMHQLLQRDRRLAEPVMALMRGLLRLEGRGEKRRR